MSRLYRYLGPPETRCAAAGKPMGCLVRAVSDVVRWIRETRQEPDRGGEITATFVVDETGTLHIADRHNEHVACAGGRPVQSAGEMSFSVKRDVVTVTSVTNQSTGYCPEPACWPAVAAALARAGLAAPEGFSTAFEFRRCVRCSTVNLVKESVFQCGVCEAPLLREWNFGGEW